MKNILLIMLAAGMILFFPWVTVYAEETGSIAEELGIDTSAITENLSPDVREFAEEHNLTVENTEAMSEITPGQVLGYIWDTFCEKLKEPLKLLASLMSVILVSAIVSSTEDTVSNKSLSKVFGIISVLITIGIISDSVSGCIDTAVEALDSGGTFMIGYVPVFAGITASSGSVTSAAAYNILVLLVAQLTVRISANYVVPILSLCMSMGIIEAINPDFHLSGITEGVKKAITFSMGFVMTIFIGLLSLQSIVGASADTLGVKAAKYMVSNWVPVVGGAVADTYATVKHSLGLLRGGAGFVGIILLFVMLVPPLLEITAMRFVFSAADIISDIFGISQVKTLIKNTSWILSTIFSILTCFAVMLIISTTILMLVGLNVA